MKFATGQLTRRLAVGSAVWASVLTSAGFANSAAADPAGWKPSRPVEFVIMAGAGGGADRATRQLIDLIEKNGIAKITFAPRNVPGRSGADAMALLSAASGETADHMLLFTLNSFYTAPLDHPDLKLEPMRFAPIARMAEDAFVLWVHSDRTTVRTFDDFVKAARAAGDRWTLAGTGRGSEDQLLTDFLNSTFRLKMRYTSFPGGGQVAKELAEKRADSTVNNPSEQSEHFAEGRTKPIATFTPRRLPLYPRTATLGEVGIAFQYFMQRSVVGPPAMSAAAREHWSRLFRTTFDTADWQSYRKRNSLVGAFLTGDDLTRYWQAESARHERWRMAIGTMRRCMSGPLLRLTIIRSTFRSNFLFRALDGVVTVEIVALSAVTDRVAKGNAEWERSRKWTAPSRPEKICRYRTRQREKRRCRR